ncbi:class I SAM-dependent methyltransferase [Aliikangiella sp. IMCC44653]
MHTNKTLYLSIFITFGLAFSCHLSANNNKDNPQVDQKLAKIIASEHRTPKNQQRDKYRNPLETLTFFGIQDSMTVAEISPGGGWYTEILAPYLKDNGLYIAAGYDPESANDYYKKSAARFKQKLDANPELYAKVKLGIMQAPDKIDFAAPESVDLVLSFRNTHNWHSKNQAETVYAAIYAALKPGGTFGLVQHRAGPQTKDTTGKHGYLKQEDVIALAKKVGFVVMATSEINANPKDTQNHSSGVWTLPPVLRAEGEEKQKVLAIGESDRMTIKFTKPAKM